MAKRATMSEGTLQTHVCKLLNAYGRYDIIWFACPNGEQRNPKTAQRLKQQGVRAGAADLMFIIDHLFHGLELKTESGHLSKAQEQFQENLERAGGIYHVAYGLNEAITILTDIEAFRPNISIRTSEARAGA
jgi:hypothetical protein